MAKTEKIVAFGEIMLRLTPPDYTTIAQARNFIANYGGGEANVLVSLSHLSYNPRSILTILTLKSPTGSPDPTYIFSANSPKLKTGFLFI